MEEYDRQDIFDKAAQAYDHAEATIKAMDDVFQNVTGSNYDASLTLAQFDMILQGVLLSVACADGTSMCWSRILSGSLPCTATCWNTSDLIRVVKLTSHGMQSQLSLMS